MILFIYIVPVRKPSNLENSSLQPNITIEDFPKQAVFQIYAPDHQSTNAAG